MPRHSLRARPAAFQPSKRGVAAVSLGAFASALILIGSLGIQEVLCAGFFGGLVALQYAESIRCRDLRRGLWLAIVLPCTALLIPTLAIVGGLDELIPSDIGLTVIYLAFWTTAGLAAGRAAERAYRTGRYAGQRLAPSRAVGLALAIGGAVGGLTIPLEGLDRVTEDYNGESFVILVSCDGGRTPFNSSEASATVSFDGGRKQDVTLGGGKAQYAAPPYFGWATIAIHLPQFRSEPFDFTIRQAGEREFLQIVARVVTLGHIDTGTGPGLALEIEGPDCDDDDPVHA